jgi:nucleoside-diphosphate-sugar epimerase
MDDLSKKYYHFFKDKIIAVTGATGYIGSNLINIFNQLPCKLRLHSRSSSNKKKLSDIAANIFHIQGELTDKTICEQITEKADIVYHLAAQTSIYKANDDPESDYMANVLPMRLLLESCRRQSQKITFIFTGTSTQCGIPTTIPVDENHPNIPVTLYDAHKLMAETYLSCYTQQNWVNGVTLRLSNIYGPGPESSTVERNVISRMIQHAIQGKELTVYGKGEYIRDYLYIDDLMDALLCIAAKRTMSGKTFYVLGSGHGTRLVDAIQMISQLVNIYTKISSPVINIPIPDSLHAIESRNFIACTDAFSNDTGWKANINLQSGLDKTIRYFLNNQKESL